MSVRLGEILVKENLITTEQLKKALEHQRHNGGKLGSVLMKLGYITDDQITGVLSRQYGVPSINLKYYEVDQNVIKLIPQDTAVRYQIVPLSRVGSTLTIAMTDPTNVFAMDDIKFMTLVGRSEEHTSELQSPCNLVCRLLLEKKKTKQTTCKFDTSSYRSDLQTALNE